MRAHLPLSHSAKLVGTWFGAGLSPKAPGTMGSIAALPFAYVIQSCWGNAGLFAASVLAFVVGWIATHAYLPHTDASDPKEIVIDEVSGQWLLLSALPFTFLSYVVGLLLFRLFDILKPWPISLADRKIKGGFGVMFDDTLAALYPVAITLAVVALGRYLGYPYLLEPLWRLLQSRYVF